MRITRKFQSAVAELVVWLKERQYTGSDDHLFELVESVENSTWTLPTKRFAHDEEFQKTFGFSKDSAAARLWMEILQLPTHWDAFESGLFQLQKLSEDLGGKTYMCRGAVLRFSPAHLIEIAGMGYDSLEKLATWPGLPSDAKILWQYDLSRIDAKIPDFCLHVESKEFGADTEGFLPPSLDLCLTKNRHGQLFADGIQLTGTDAWIEGTHNFEDGRYR